MPAVLVLVLLLLLLLLLCLWVLLLLRPRRQRVARRLLEHGQRLDVGGRHPRGRVSKKFCEGEGEKLERRKLTFFSLL